MIFYFSGNGNTRHAAESLAAIINESCVAITDVNVENVSFQGKSLGIIFPVYSWGVPPVITDFIAGLNEKFISDVNSLNAPVWSVCTCGDETGMAHKMMHKILRKQSLDMKGIWSIIMPNTYVILPGFDVDSKELENDKLKKAQVRINEIGERIKACEWETDVTVGSVPHLKTFLVYPLFKRYGINPRKWHYTDSCVKCGICADKCPVGNIALVNGSPVWGNNCVSCLACYNYCPVNAVQYGNATKSKRQYHFPDRK